MGQFGSIFCIVIADFVIIPIKKLGLQKFAYLNSSGLFY
jgi:hypothetical protein